MIALRTAEVLELEIDFLLTYQVKLVTVVEFFQLSVTGFQFLYPAAEFLNKFGISQADFQAYDLRKIHHRQIYRCGSRRNHRHREYQISDRCFRME